MIDYKKIIRSQKLRLKILELLSFIPDKQMIQIQYKIKTGRKLNLKDPRRYTEKLQWYKLYYRDQLMAQCADKYKVREYVKSKGLNYILNDFYGVFKNESEIDFKKLPETFVLKTTNGGGGNNIIICDDREKFDENEAKQLLKDWIKPRNKDYGREWVYYNSDTKIIAEKVLPRDKNNDLPDYKFYCFNGEVYCIHAIIDYVDDHSNGKIGFYDKFFNKMPFTRLEYKPIESDLDKPKNLDKMIEIAEILSKDFPHVRVDLYNIEGQIIFGELTFFTASGYTMFNPDEFDFILGKQFELPEKSK